MEFITEVDPVPIFKDLNALLQEHKEELCLFPETPLAPDWAAYARLARCGNLCVITARKGQKIVGYTISVLSRHLHYPFLMAVNDILYLEPKYRGHGIRLIKQTERVLKERGARFFSLSIKPHVDFRPVVERLGYELLEYQYFRRL